MLVVLLRCLLRSASGLSIHLKFEASEEVSNRLGRLEKRIELLEEIPRYLLRTKK